MDSDTIVGIAILAVSLVAVAGLVLVCRAIIERIAARGARSAREILNGRN